MLYAARTVCATRSATRFWQRIGSRRFSSFDFLLHLAQASVDVTRFHLPRLVGLAARCSNQPRATCLVWETAHDPGAAFDRLAQSLPLGLQYSSLLTSNSGWCRRPAKGLTRSFRGCIPHTLYLPHDAHGRQRVGTIGQVMGGQLRIRKSGRVFSAKAPSLVHSRTLITTQIQPHSNPFLNTAMLCPK